MVVNGKTRKVAVLSFVMEGHGALKSVLQPASRDARPHKSIFYTARDNLVNSMVNRLRRAAVRFYSAKDKNYTV